MIHLRIVGPHSPPFTQRNHNFAFIIFLTKTNTFEKIYVLKQSVALNFEDVINMGGGGVPGKLRDERSAGRKKARPLKGG